MYGLRALYTNNVGGTNLRRNYISRYADKKGLNTSGKDNIIGNTAIATLELWEVLQVVERKQGYHLTNPPALNISPLDIAISTRICPGKPEHLFPDESVTCSNAVDSNTIDLRDVEAANSTVEAVMLGLAMAINCSSLARIWRTPTCGRFKLLARLLVLSCCGVVVTIQKHNLKRNIRWAADWSTFPFENTTLQQFWEEATYGFNETIYVYALNYKPLNVATESRMNLLSGQCHTFKPQTQTTESGVDVGYALTLRRGGNDNDDNDVGETNSCNNGWMVYIHSANEVWMENASHAKVQAESLCVDQHQELYVRLNVDEFNILDNQRAKRCVPDPNYSLTQCENTCHWSQLAEKYGCSAPFMPGIDYQHCSNGSNMRLLVRDFMNKRWNDSQCVCPSPCNNVFYRPYVVNRRAVDSQYSQVYIFFSSHLLINVREHYAYDWSLFIADLGGSLGFLLGLSVIGLINLLERLVETALSFSERRQYLGSRVDDMRVAVISSKSQAHTTQKSSPPRPDIHTKFEHRHT
uniref:Uncharacterized protein n=1 Tax=Timema genevievae TaxID=629358 RepID=A0A7R9K0Y8_TIMGE|nr:unnamed protein product [Timema genevievae]